MSLGNTAFLHIARRSHDKRRQLGLLEPTALTRPRSWLLWHKRNQRSLLALDVTVKKCGKPGSFGKCWFFLCYACIVNLTSAKFSNTIKIKSHVCSWSWFLDCFPSLFSVKLISKGGTQSSVILGEGQWKLSRWSSEAMLRGMTTSQ